MRLRSLEVDNFRAFPIGKSTIDLDHDAVLVYGRNGVGKTALFDAIELTLTGALRRLDAVRDISSVLVNARHDSMPATIRIVADDGTGRREGRAHINSQGPHIDPILGPHETPLFQHTVYLQQSDIRRLISADSTDLGDVVRTLAISGEIEKLDRALSEAGLTRQNRIYASAVKSLDERHASAEQLRLQIQSDERALAEIEGVEAVVSKCTAEIMEIGVKLNAPQTDRLDKPSDIRQAVDRLDAILQPRLVQEIGKRAQADARFRRASDLLEQQRQISATRNSIETPGQLNRLQLELTAAIQEVQTCQKELAQSKFNEVAKQQQSKIVALLEAARFLVDQDICPVCDRPYKDLRAHLDSKLKHIAQAQSDLQATYSELRRRLSEAQERQIRAQQELEKTDQGSKRLEARLLAFQRELEEFSTASVSGDSALEKALSEERALQEDARLEIEALSAVAVRLSGIRSQLEAIVIRSTRIAESLASARRQLDHILLRLSAAEKSRQALEDYVNMAQEVRKRTSEGIERVLNSFAMGSTRENFEDLFNRLAKAPLFGVTVSEARVIRRRPEVRWCATYKQKQYPGDAIFSQGELNSCAMAFFLALATTNPQSLGFLLLDDPVQNMDEIHIEEFGSILKFIKDQLGWQIIVALHDESIYQYLKRQLYPCKGAQSLVGYALEMTDAGTEIVQDVRTLFDPKAFITADVA